MTAEGDAERGRQDTVADIVRRYEETDGRDGDFRGIPLVILTTRGRRTGRLHKTPLLRVERDGTYIVVASGPDPIGGTPVHAQWYLNLVAHPEVTVRDGAQVHELVARTATPEEKASWWLLALATWPDYDTYQANTTKIIPLVILAPASPT